MDHIKENIVKARNFERTIATTLSQLSDTSELKGLEYALWCLKELEEPSDGIRSRINELKERLDANPFV